MKLSFRRIILGKLLLRCPTFGRPALVGIVLIVILILLVYLSHVSNDSDQAIATDLPPEPVAQVKTLYLKKAEIQKNLMAYGVVLPLPDKLQTISVSYPSQIEKIRVNPGQLVQSGTVLLSLKPGPTALLQWHQAQTELQAALRNQQVLQQRIRLKLATRQDLISAQLRVDQARVMIKNLADQGINKIKQISARHSGIIYQVNVQQGQQLPAGAPLLQIVAQNQWVVRLGVEPEDYEYLKIDQQILMLPVNTADTEPVQGRIEMISHQIDPNTRLLNVFVRPELNQTLFINDFVKARIIIDTVNTWLVPRQAVLSEEGGYALFSIVNGRAVKHQVQLGLENDRQVEVISDDLHEQDEIVILGNYELQPGMATIRMTETEK